MFCTSSALKLLDKFSEYEAWFTVFPSSELTSCFVVTNLCGFCKVASDGNRLMPIFYIEHCCYGLNLQSSVDSDGAAHH